MSGKRMTPSELESLIAVGEGPLLEFKRSGTAHLGREICAFANTLGGRILIGVDDAGRRHPLQHLNSLRSEVQTIARNLEPPLMVECEEVAGILVVTVPESRHKPHSAAGKFYLREGASSQQMNRDEIREFFYREGLIYFDEKANDRFRWPDDFADEAFAAFPEAGHITPALPAETILRNLGLLKPDGMSYAGSLLFSRQVSRFVPGAAVNCSLFQGRATTRVLDQKVFDGDLLSNYRSAINYLLSHLNTRYEIGVERKEQLEIPEGALREALLNAMAHRDYRKPGDLQVHIFLDRVEIINPGGLVGGMTLEKLGSVSLPRNPLLFGMMHRMGLVEKIGSGLKRIADMCREQQTTPPEIQADQDWFRIVFQRAATGVGEVLSGKRRESVGKTTVETTVETTVKTPDLVLSAFREDPQRTLAEVADAIGKSIRAVERASAKLIKAGKLRYVGPKKGGHWEVLE